MYVAESQSRCQSTVAAAKFNFIKQMDSSIIELKSQNAKTCSHLKPRSRKASELMIKVKHRAANPTCRDGETPKRDSKSNLVCLQSSPKGAMHSEAQNKALLCNTE
jgi:hypothetical protein